MATKIPLKNEACKLYREASQWKTAQTADIFHIRGAYWADLEYIISGIYLANTSASRWL